MTITDVSIKINYDCIIFKCGGSQPKSYAPVFGVPEVFLGPVVKVEKGRARHETRGSHR